MFDIIDIFEGAFYTIGNQEHLNHVLKVRKEITPKISIRILLNFEAIISTFFSHFVIIGVRRLTDRDFVLEPFSF